MNEPIDYLAIEQAYREAVQGSAEPGLMVIGGQAARISDHRQVRKLKRLGWTKSAVSCQDRGKVLMVHPVFRAGLTIR